MGEHAWQVPLALVPAAGYPADPTLQRVQLTRSGQPTTRPSRAHPPGPNPTRGPPPPPPPAPPPPAPHPPPAPPPAVLPRSPPVSTFPSPGPVPGQPFVSGVCRSGQSGQTVNLVANAYGGSNPPAPISLFRFDRS